MNQLKNINNIIAVSSCKGGVGKSTIASHIAMELSRQGYPTGLLDADIYGPSVPSLFQIFNADIKTNQEKQFIPIDYKNLKLMSFGFLLKDSPAIIRGPIATRYIQQLFLNTAWGNLEYLIVDMPPGTGDIHITITQTVQLSGAIIVTTPHSLALADVIRGILMFEKMNVPILGVVENMSYFTAKGSTEKNYIFGENITSVFQEKFGIEALAEIPIMEEMTQNLTAYKPNKYIQSCIQKAFKILEERKNSQFQLPNITCDDAFITLQWKNGKEQKVKNFDLRLNSQDAYSINELTGEKILKAESIRKDIKARKIIPIGNYAIGIEWNDGHTSGIYTYQLIDKLSKKSA